MKWIKKGKGRGIKGGVWGCGALCNCYGIFDPSSIITPIPTPIPYPIIGPDPAPFSGLH